MSVVTAFTPGASFWECNPQLLLDKTLKAYYKKDTSRAKKASSAVMWWVAFCYDKDRDNKWASQDLQDKQRALGEELELGEDVFEKRKAELEPLIEAYLGFTDTEAKKAVRSWENKIRERRLFLDETKYTLGNIGDKGNWVGGTATILDGMLANTKKLYDEYTAIRKMLDNEDNAAVGKGDSMASLSDKGEI